MAANKDETWGAILRGAVEASELTRYRVAKEAGIGETLLARFMRGEGIRLETAEKIGRVVGVRLTAPRKRPKQR